MYFDETGLKNDEIRSLKNCFKKDNNNNNNKMLKQGKTLRTCFQVLKAVTFNKTKIKQFNVHSFRDYFKHQLEYLPSQDPQTSTVLSISFLKSFIDVASIATCDKPFQKGTTRLVKKLYREVQPFTNSFLSRNE
jgi:hypothetical protein